MTLREMFEQHPELLTEEGASLVVAVHDQGGTNNRVALGLTGSPPKLGFSLGLALHGDMDPLAAWAFMIGLMQGMEAPQEGVTTVASVSGRRDPVYRGSRLPPYRVRAERPTGPAGSPGAWAARDGPGAGDHAPAVRPALADGRDVPGAPGGVNG